MKNRPITTLCMALAISTSSLFAEHTSMPCDKCTKLDKVNEMKEEMQLKLKFDPLVNLPILARTFNQHNQDVTYH